MIDNIQTAEERLAEFLKRGYAPAWMPEEGKAPLIGHVTEIGTYDAGFGDYPIITVETSAGEEHAYHALSQVAQDTLIGMRPAIGDLIGIFYAGRRDSRTRKDKDGKPVSYHDVRIMTEDEMNKEQEKRNAAATGSVWDKLAADAAKRK